MRCAPAPAGARLIDRDADPPPPPTDPFADEGDPLNSSQDVGSQQNYIHIRIQQRNGRKTLTTLQGLPKGLSPPRVFVVRSACADTPARAEYDLKKLLKAFKKASRARDPAAPLVPRPPAEVVWLTSL